MSYGTNFPLADWETSLIKPHPPIRNGAIIIVQLWDEERVFLYQNHSQEYGRDPKTSAVNMRAALLEVLECIDETLPIDVVILNEEGE